MSHHGGRAFHGSGHGKQKKGEAEKEKVELAEEEEEEEDPFDTRIKKSGCADLHYALLVSLMHFPALFQDCTLFKLIEALAKLHLITVYTHIYAGHNHWSRGKQSGLFLRETREKTKLPVSFETSSQHSQSNVWKLNSIALNLQIVFS